MHLQSLQIQLKMAPRPGQAHHTADLQRVVTHRQPWPLGHEGNAHLKPWCEIATNPPRATVKRTTELTERRGPRVTWNNRQVPNSQRNFQMHFLWSHYRPSLPGTCQQKMVTCTRDQNSSPARWMVTLGARDKKGHAATATPHRDSSLQPKVGPSEPHTEVRTRSFH